MDPLGLHIGHSPDPNLAMLAVHEPRLGFTFTAVWPIKPIHRGTLCISMLIIGLSLRKFGGS